MGRGGGPKYSPEISLFLDVGIHKLRSLIRDNPADQASFIWSQMFGVHGKAYDLTNGFRHSKGILGYGINKDSPAKVCTRSPIAKKYLYPSTEVASIMPVSTYKVQ